ncbi:MAG TPA: hypothetical protein VKR24_02070, partial [Candidatus Limnocylindrales bacterium]|nr:hypothetical protein [Candidatus Limnocylindrales bacterium]
MDGRAVFTGASPRTGMYESFFLRAVSPDEPVGAWLRYTVHKNPGEQAWGSVWTTVFDGRPGGPFMHKITTHELGVPADGWLTIGTDAAIGPGEARGTCGDAHWSVEFETSEPDLYHLAPRWLYRAPLPRTKLTSPAPSATFSGRLTLAGRETLNLDGWRGMVGHNWGSEHAERWIWLHGVGFEEDASAWIDVALGRLRVGGRLTPWIANGAISSGGRRVHLGGLLTRGVTVAETPAGCEVRIPGQGGLVVHGRAQVPAGSAAGWRYGDPGGGEHDVLNCSVARIELEIDVPGSQR